MIQDFVLSPMWKVTKIITEMFGCMLDGSPISLRTELLSEPLGLLVLIERDYEIVSKSMSSEHEFRSNQQIQCQYLCSFVRMDKHTFPSQEYPLTF